MRADEFCRLQSPIGFSFWHTSLDRLRRGVGLQTLSVEDVATVGIGTDKRIVQFYTKGRTGTVFVQDCYTSRDEAWSAMQANLQRERARLKAGYGSAIHKLSAAEQNSDE